MSEMQKDFGQNDPRLLSYVRGVFQPEDDVLKEIRLRSEREGLPQIQVGDMDRLHLEVLTSAFGARKVVEIGTLGGYSGVSITRGLGPQGKLYTFEYDPHHAKVARESFEKAGVAGQVEVLVGAALKNLPAIEKYGPFDLVFIDADKENYPGYLKWAAKHLRVGGAVLADNTFAWGHLADESFDDAELEQMVRGIREFNELCARSGQFKATILPTGEGLTLAVKIKS